MATRIIAAPIGPIELRVQDGALVALTMLPKVAKPTPRLDNEPVSLDDRAVLDETERQLGDYFASTRRDFDLPLKPEGTAFRLRVWRALSEIPYGEVRAYGDLAIKLKTAPRAVGGACGANPIGIVVPCHRVVGGKGALVGFSGGDGCDTKKVLLALEARSPLFEQQHVRI
ncbi:MAG: methylated-DNA--[protein]-cysteine S-methyltransferase [Alphaproteobacteria bacterium]|nr:methylated-DNA--[protein]-cysteine S-methyltransferase [Alphaproteobacteria bacterium]